MIGNLSLPGQINLSFTYEMDAAVCPQMEWHCTKITNNGLGFIKQGEDVLYRKDLKYLHSNISVQMFAKTLFYSGD